MGKKRRFEDDPVLTWAEQIENDEALQHEASYQHFLELRDEYRALLRRFTQVMRLSDGYQESMRDLKDSLYEASRKDPLTGLSNRRDMMDRLMSQRNRGLRHQESFSLILADIDNYGHEVGDTVLVNVAQALHRSLRAEDIFARWGGEEFLVCLPYVELPVARQVGEKLRSNVEELIIRRDQEELQVTISAGVATFSGQEALDDLIRRADGAMYEAKRLGRNRVLPAS